MVGFGGQESVLYAEKMQALFNLGLVHHDEVEAKVFEGEWARQGGYRHPMKSAQGPKANVILAQFSRESL